MLAVTSPSRFDGQVTVGQRRAYAEVLGLDPQAGIRLGLDGSYSGFQSQFRDGLFIDITSPRPFAGLEVVMSNGPHIDGFGTTPLMVPDPTPGWRQLISGVDALVIAQLSGFDRPDLNGSAHVVMVSPTLLPAGR